MIKIMKRHIWYYLSLCSVLLAAVVLITQTTDSATQMLGVVMVGFFYVTWGIVHHYKEHDLTAKIVIEYVLIGTLGISVIFFLLSVL